MIDHIHMLDERVTQIGDILKETGTTENSTMPPLKPCELASLDDAGSPENKKSDKDQDNLA